MDQAGLWRMFFKTGLPEVYLALRGVRREDEEYPSALAAFRPRPSREAES